jgi:hypothetical protein
MRGQTGLGVLKLLIDVFAIWTIVDFVIALTKYSHYDDEFIFIDGKWKV